MRFRSTTTRSARSGAALYLTVMGVGMIVAVIALASSEVGRQGVASSTRLADRHTAVRAAKGGIEYVLNWLNRNPDWRTTQTSGAEVGPWRTGDGRFYWTITDADGDLADDARDHAVLRVRGNHGDVNAVLEVDVEPAGRALTCLEAAVCAGDDVNVNDDGRLTGSGFVHANDNTWGGGGASFDLDAHAVGTTHGGDYNGDEFRGVAARELPGDHVFDWYLKVGAEIKLSDLSNIFGTRYMQWDFFSRQVNTHGSPNPRGVYWIDCGGQNVRIKWGRQLGTLVLLDVGPDSRVEDVCVLQAEAQNYPVLLVQGDIDIDLRSSLTGQEMREASVTNYNPPGVPYNGVSDNDKKDDYPARLDGIVYATGRITFTDDSEVHGAIVAGGVVAVAANDELRIEYRPYAFDYPPPGFSAGHGARMLPGTLRRVGM